MHRKLIDDQIGKTTTIILREALGFFAIGQLAVRTVRRKKDKRKKPNLT